MTAHTQDDAFHEIQLGGKQLAFLFMAATLVSVVIFLCGVFVGRGVRAERGIIVDTETPADSLTREASASNPPASVGDPTVATAPTTAPTGPRTEDLTYLQRLEQPNSVREEQAPAPKAPTLSAAPSAAADGPRPSSGWSAQVSAVNTRAAADKLVNRLSSKGYSNAFVLPAGVFYRVRVGPFKTKPEAEAASEKLNAEEQFKSFVTR